MISTNDVSVLLGAIVQPKTKEPIWVRRKLDTWRSVEIYLGHSYNEIIGEGYLDGGDMGAEYLNSVKITGFPRSHTPNGIKYEFKDQGFGTCLYTGLVLIASAIYDKELKATGNGSVMPGHGKGITSDDESRSESANKWWSGAVDRGLASQETGERAYGGDDDDDPDGETEVLEDEDLFDYMNSAARSRVTLAVSSGVEQYSEWYVVERSIELKGTVQRTVYPEAPARGLLTADYYTLTSAEKHKLIAIRETFQGRLDQWAKAQLTDEGEYHKDVILALNVSQQNAVVVGKLAACALDRGASETEVTAMMMRNRFGIDLLNRAIGRQSVEDVRLGGGSAEARGVMVANPRRRGIPKHEPRPAPPPVRNPAPTSSEQREIDRSLDKLERLRDDLGWNKLEDLP